MRIGLKRCAKASDVSATLRGENLTIEQRWAEGKYERLPDLAAELVRSDVELILTWGTPATRAVLSATTKIPLVTIVVADLLSTGLIQSLARPGGNLTGQTFFSLRFAPNASS